MSIKIKKEYLEAGLAFVGGTLASYWVHVNPGKFSFVESQVISGVGSVAGFVIGQVAYKQNRRLSARRSTQHALKGTSRKAVVLKHTKNG